MFTKTPSVTRPAAGYAAPASHVVELGVEGLVCTSPSFGDPGRLPGDNEGPDNDDTNY